MKKIIFVFLLLATNIVIMSAENFEKIQIGDVYYNLNIETMTAEVTSPPTSKYWQSTIDIPSCLEYNGDTYNVTRIGANAFDQCHNLERIRFSEGIVSIGDRAFYKCDKLRSVTLPQSLIRIEGHAFYSCSYFGSIEVPNNVVTIGEYAFSWCQHAKYAIIGNGVTSIGKYAFEKCVELSRVEMGTNVQTINEGAFWHCEALSGILLPSTLTYIGNQGFFYCNNLCPFTCLAVTPPSLGYEVFGGVEKGHLDVPAESVVVYKQTAQWNEFNIWAIEDEEAIDEINDGKTQVKKSLHDAQIYILRGEKAYTLQGQEVK